MKKFITALLACLLVLSLSVTAFADGYAQKIDDYKDMVEYAAKQTPAITLTDQYFTVDPDDGYSHYKFEFSTNSREDINVLFCMLLKGTNVEQQGDALSEYVFPFVENTPMIQFSSSRSCAYETQSSYLSSAFVKLGAKIGVGVVTEVSEPTQITLKIYAKATAFTGTEEPTKTVTFTIQPKTTTASDAISLDIRGEDKSDSPGLQVYAGDEVTVGFTVPEGFNGTGASFTYNSNVFELVGSAPSSWVEAGGMYSYAVPSDGVTSDSLGEFKFKAKAQSIDDAEGEFTVTSSYSGSTENKAETESVDVIFKTIQYEIENVQSISGFNQVTTTYNGQPQHVAINVTEPAEYAIQYAYGSYTTSPEEWTNSVPEFTDVSNLNNPTYVHFKISADGYKTAQGLVDFYIRKATVNIAVNDVTINAGDPLPEKFKYTVTGLLGENELIKEPTITCSAADTSKPGTYTLTASGAEAGSNYTITYATGTLTVKEAELNVPKTHAITVIDPSNGTIKVNPSNGSAGTLITVTATPDEGYELAYVTVDGEKISGSTFRMPDHDVTVSGVFVPVTFPFVDVKPGDWFYEYVVYVYSNGLMDGTSATTFEPNANMTRAMVWTILARIDGETVTGANWIDTARAWAMAEGVSDGTDPNGLVTREQFATMLWRYAGEPASSYSLAKFTDNASVSDWASTAMSWAVENGVITGVTESTLVPQGTATRAQCAAMLMRFVEL